MARSRRRGSVVERGTGKFSYVVTLPTGKQQWVSGFTSRDDAERALTKRLAELDQGIGDNPRNDTVAEYLAEWLAGKEVRGNTYINYAGVIRTHINPAIGSVQLGRVRPEDVARLARTMGQAAPSMIVHARAVLGQAFDQAVRYGHVARNVARLVEWPAYRVPEMAFYDQTEARALLAAAEGDRWHVAVRLLLACGLRRGEVLALHWGDVELREGWLSVRRTVARDGLTKAWFVQEIPKTSAGRRTFRLDATTLELLGAHKARARGVLVVTNEHGQRASVDALDHALKRLMDTAGLRRIRVHDLRHTHVTLARRAGESWDSIARRVGHTSGAFTASKYGHLLPAEVEEAAERLGQVFG